MKSTTRRNRKGRTSSAPTVAKARWVPGECRPVTMPDRRAKASKEACRGKVAW